MRDLVDSKFFLGEDINLVGGFFQAENRWAGLCLLGVTCQECSRQRFLECYNSWFTKLLLFFKVYNFFPSNYDVYCTILVRGAPSGSRSNRGDSKKMCKEGSKWSSERIAT